MVEEMPLWAQSLGSLLTSPGLKREVRDPRPYPITCRMGGCGDWGMSASRRLVSAVAPGSTVSSLGLSYSEKTASVADPAGWLTRTLPRNSPQAGTTWLSG